MNMTELNENHQRAVMIGFRYIDELLSDIERILAASEAPQTPFPKYRQPIESIGRSSSR